MKKSRLVAVMQTALASAEAAAIDAAKQRQQADSIQLLLREAEGLEEQARSGRDRFDRLVEGFESMTSDEALEKALADLARTLPESSARAFEHATRICVLRFMIEKRPELEALARRRLIDEPEDKIRKFEADNAHLLGVGSD